MPLCCFSIPSREGKRKRVQHVFGCWRTRFLFVPRSGGVGYPPWECGLPARKGKAGKMPALPGEKEAGG